MDYRLMRYYIIAGERSGDLHGSNLVKAIRNHDPDAIFRGLGGEYLQQAGVELFVHYAEFAVMGFVEVLLNIIKISGYLRKCGKDIVAFKADVVILIDYAGFNRQMARIARKKSIRVYYYISPKVWAWNQGRAHQLKANVDRMFVILPFEKDFYKRFNWEVDYVGNPVLDAVKSHQPDNAFLSKRNLNAGSPIVALLPGSRKQELLGVIPVMSEVVTRFPEIQFAVATVNNLDQDLYGLLKGFSNVRFVQEDTYNLLRYADAAIVTSGTATLETALFRVPQMVVYKAARLSYLLAKMVIRVPYISLVNLIAGKEVVKELIQDNASAEKMSAELKALLSDTGYRKGILENYDAIIKVLDTGSASENAARLMVGYLRG
ncbi:MAG: lipid-A-disaccharide synthase [Cyclobacteriaceae bacterium]